MAKPMTLSRLPRAARGAVIAVVLALVCTAPAAAAQPTRTVTYADPFTHYPAGTFCDFPITVYRTPGARTTDTTFSDGREVIENHSVQRTEVNDANGKAFVTTSVHLEVDRLDVANNVYRGTSSGQSIFTFGPGDVGPDGAIVDHYFAIFIRGTATYVVDATTFLFLALSIQGTYTDICAAIS